MERDKGIGRDGPAWVSVMLVQMAWRWLRDQADSAPSQWFNNRFGDAKGRICRMMIAAFVRKLVIALWRYNETGHVPTVAPD